MRGADFSSPSPSPACCVQVAHCRTQSSEIILKSWGESKRIHTRWHEAAWGSYLAERNPPRTRRRRVPIAYTSVFGPLKPFACTRGR